MSDQDKKTTLGVNIKAENAEKAGQEAASSFSKGFEDSIKKFGGFDNFTRNILAMATGVNSLFDPLDKFQTGLASTVDRVLTSLKNIESATGAIAAKIGADFKVAEDATRKEQEALKDLAGATKAASEEVRKNGETWNFNGRCIKESSDALSKFRAEIQASTSFAGGFAARLSQIASEGSKLNAATSGAVDGILAFNSALGPSAELFLRLEGIADRVWSKVSSIHIEPLDFSKFGSTSSQAITGIEALSTATIRWTDKIAQIPAVVQTAMAQVIKLFSGGQIAVSQFLSSAASSGLNSSVALSALSQLKELGVVSMGEATKGTGNTLLLEDNSAKSFQESMYSEQMSKPEASAGALDNLGRLPSGAGGTAEYKQYQAAVLVILNNVNTLVKAGVAASVKDISGVFAQIQEMNAAIEKTRAAGGLTEKPGQNAQFEYQIAQTVSNAKEKLEDLRKKISQVTEEVKKETSALKEESVQATASKIAIEQLSKETNILFIETDEVTSAIERGTYDMGKFGKSVGIANENAMSFSSALDDLISILVISEDRFDSFNDEVVQGLTGPINSIKLLGDRFDSFNDEVVQGLTGPINSIKLLGGTYRNLTEEQINLIDRTTLLTAALFRLGNNQSDVDHLYALADAAIDDHNKFDDLAVALTYAYNILQAGNKIIDTSTASIKKLTLAEAEETAQTKAATVADAIEAQQMRLLTGEVQKEEDAIESLGTALAVVSSMPGQGGEDSSDPGTILYAKTVGGKYAPASGGGGSLPPSDTLLLPSASGGGSSGGSGSSGSSLSLWAQSINSFSSTVKAQLAPLKEFEDAIGGLFQAFGPAAWAIGTAGAALVGFGAILYAKLAIINEAIQAMHRFAEEILAMNNRAAESGASIAKFSEIAPAFQAVGIPIQDVENRLAMMAYRIRDTISGTGVLTGAFGLLGVEVKDQATGGMRDMVDVITDMSDIFAALPNGMEKSSLAIEIFGRYGSNMLAILNRGSAALREWIQLSKDLNLVFDDQIKEQGLAAQEAWTRTAMVFESMQVTVQKGLMPAFVEFLETTATGMQKWWLEIVKAEGGFGVLQTKMELWGKSAFSIVTDLIEAFKTLGGWMVSAGSWFASNPEMTSGAATGAKVGGVTAGLFGAAQGAITGGAYGMAQGAAIGSAILPAGGTVVGGGIGLLLGLLTGGAIGGVAAGSAGAAAGGVVGGASGLINGENLSKEELEKLSKMSDAERKSTDLAKQEQDLTARLATARKEEQVSGWSLPTLVEDPKEIEKKLADVRAASAEAEAEVEKTKSILTGIPRLVFEAVTQAKISVINAEVQYLAAQQTIAEQIKTAEIKNAHDIFNERVKLMTQRMTIEGDMEKDRLNMEWNAANQDILLERKKLDVVKEIEAAKTALYQSTQVRYLQIQKGIIAADQSVFDAWTNLEIKKQTIAQQVANGIIAHYSKLIDMQIELAVLRNTMETAVLEKELQTMINIEKTNREILALSGMLSDEEDRKLLIQEKARSLELEILNIRKERMTVWATRDLAAVKEEEELLTKMMNNELERYKMRENRYIRLAAAISDEELKLDQMREQFYKNQATRDVRLAQAKQDQLLGIQGIEFQIEKLKQDLADKGLLKTEGKLTAERDFLQAQRDTIVQGSAFNENQKKGYDTTVNTMKAAWGLSSGMASSANNAGAFATNMAVAANATQKAVDGITGELIEVTGAAEKMFVGTWMEGISAATDASNKMMQELSKRQDAYNKKAWDDQVAYAKKSMELQTYVNKYGIENNPTWEYTDKVKYLAAVTATSKAYNDEILKNQAANREAQAAASATSSANKSLASSLNSATTAQASAAAQANKTTSAYEQQAMAALTLAKAVAKPAQTSTYDYATANLAKYTAMAANNTLPTAAEITPSSGGLSSRGADYYNALNEATRRLQVAMREANVPANVKSAPSLTQKDLDAISKLVIAATPNIVIDGVTLGQVITKIARAGNLQVPQNALTIK
jgi:hypothetical protein